MSAATTITSQAPDWDFVPFDVDCARCGHDLRGLSEPKCPACDFEFDWGDAVPIESLTCLYCEYRLYGLTETRCPECGQPFTWDEAIEAYHRRKHPLFEYRWRERPVHSYVHSFLRALRPRKLWQAFDIHDPPAVTPLLVMAVGSLMIVAVVVAVFFVFESFLLNWVSPYGPFLDIGQVLSLSGAIAWGVERVAFLWSVSSLAALMIFRQSMRRYRVRTPHVVRVWAYAVPLVLPLTAAATWGFMLAAVTAIRMLGRGSPLVRPWELAFGVAAAAVVVLSVFHVLRSIRHGYGTYLRMWHGWGIAIASQVIAVLATMTILTVIETW